MKTNKNQPKNTTEKNKKTTCIAGVSVICFWTYTMLSKVWALTAISKLWVMVQGTQQSLHTKKNPVHITMKYVMSSRGKQS